jgi:plasmid stability protein
MKNLTIRNVPDDLHEALQRERLRQDRSLNQTVLDLLRQRLAVGTTPSNGLASLAGRWTDEELRVFEQATARFEEADEEVWR